MMGVASYDIIDQTIESNHIVAGKKRVKSWLLDTSAGEIRSPKMKFANKSYDEECSNGNEGNSDTSCEPFSPTNRGERIVINVGGSRHETYIGTLHSVPDTRLYWITEKHVLSPEYDQEKQEYFFDRHPGLFPYILDYYRTGKLHCPAEICGPLFEEELLFWGIDEAVIEPCCWMNYQKHRDAEVNLQSFDSLDGDEERNSAQPSDVENQEQQGEGDGPSNERRGTMNIIYRKWAFWQPKVWTTLEEPNSSKAAQIIGLISMTLIVLSVTTFCLETLHVFADEKSIQNRILYHLEVICVSWFTLEFFLRLIFSAGKLAFFKSPMNWIDFCAICPFFLEIILRKNDMKTIVVLRVVRITRLFRIFKLSRHSYGLQILGHTLKSSCRELFLLVFFLSIAVIIFSSLIYYAEKDFQGDKFDSIPGSFWWSVVTMTTIGYGDIVPKTVPGKCVGIMCALCGVLVIALPIPVIVNNFSLYYSHAQARLRVSGKRKKPLLFGAANALRMTDPWASNKLLQKQRSEQSDFTAILPSPRRTPVASPTPSLRQFAGGPWDRKIVTRPAFSRNSPCASMNSSLNSRASGKTPPISRKVSNNNADDNTVSKQSSPARSRQIQLPVIRLSPNYESPSINVSPPSTPSKTNSQNQSSIGTPFPMSPCAESSVYSNDGIYTPKTSTCPSRKDSSPLHSPLFLCSPGKSTLSTCISDLMTMPTTPCSLSSSSSKLASPRGRMGRRNGICILGYQSKMPQRKKPGAPRVRKTSTRSYLDSSDSQVSSRRDSRAMSIVGDAKSGKFCLSAPSPGVSKTLFEVSRRLETMLPEESEQSVPERPKARKNTVVSTESVKSQFSSRSSSPLVRQRATNTTLDSFSSQETETPGEKLDVTMEQSEEEIPKLESVANGLIFKRRKQRLEGENETQSEQIRGAFLQEPTGLSPNISLKLGGSLRNTIGPPNGILLSPKSKSMDDVRSSSSEKNEIRKIVSVNNSPGSPGTGKFQYMISCGRFSASANGCKKKTLDEPSASCSVNLCMLDKSNDKSNLDKSPKGRLAWNARTNGELGENRTENKKSFQLPSLDSMAKDPLTSSPVQCRKFRVSSRNPWANRFGQVQDSGIHSMSLTQDACTLDLPLDNLSESPLSDKDTGSAKQLESLLENAHKPDEAISRF